LTRKRAVQVGDDRHGAPAPHSDPGRRLESEDSGDPGEIGLVVVGDGENGTGSRHAPTRVRFGQFVSTIAKSLEVLAPTRLRFGQFVSTIAKRLELLAPLSEHEDTPPASERVGDAGAGSAGPLLGGGSWFEDRPHSSI
jgi:hypothetical protein